MYPYRVLPNASLFEQRLLCSVLGENLGLKPGKIKNIGVQMLHNNLLIINEI